VAPVTTPAILLRAHDYGDSSRILRFYTRDHGLLSVVARGVRGRSGKGTTALASFASGELGVYVKAHRDLHTMKDFHCSRLREGLGGEVLRFSGASAAAELVLGHAQQETQPGVFDALERALDLLDSVDGVTLPGTVLAALWSIIESFGFAPQLDGCIRCGGLLGSDEVGRFDFAAGGMRCAECAEGAAGPRLGPGARSQIDTFLHGDVPEDFGHPRRHLALVSDFIAYHVASKPLKSLRFLGSVMPPDREVSDA
jgi:DNA repair protein RecO (recombination protein O)